MMGLASAMFSSVGGSGETMMGLASAMFNSVGGSGETMMGLASAMFSSVGGSGETMMGLAAKANWEAEAKAKATKATRDLIEREVISGTLLVAKNERCNERVT
jgi:hypothetical protein